MTVEDPAEAFEDLRDRNDLAMLLGHTAFMAEAFGSDVVSNDGGRVGRVRTSVRAGTRAKSAGGKLGPPVDRPWFERWRKELKIAGVCFLFMCRYMLLLSILSLDVSDFSLSPAPVPPAHRDADPIAPEPNGCASGQGVQAASEGTIVPFQLCQLGGLAWLGTIRLTCPCLQEVLVQLEEKERLEKLEETFQSVRKDYQRILAMVR